MINVYVQLELHSVDLTLELILLYWRESTALDQSPVSPLVQSLNWVALLTQCVKIPIGLPEFDAV